MRILLNEVPKQFSKCFNEDGRVRTTYLIECVCNPSIRKYQQGMGVDKESRHHIKTDIISRLKPLVPNLVPDYNDIKLIIGQDDKLVAVLDTHLYAVISNLWLKTDS